MKFEWDKFNKNKIFEKYGLLTEQVEQVFLNNPFFTFNDIKHSDSEKRYLGFGKTDDGVRVLVVFTFRGIGDKNLILPISARKMSRKERRLYDEKSTAEI